MVWLTLKCVNEARVGGENGNGPWASGVMGRPGRLTAITKRTAAREPRRSERRNPLDNALCEQMLASATDAVNAVCTFAQDQPLADFGAREEYVLNVGRA